MDIPWRYYVIAIFITVIIGLIWRWEGALLSGYVFLIITETVLNRTPFAGNHLKLDLFWSWREWETQKLQILTNVVMFVPLGAFAGCLWKWKGIFVAIALSLTIELLQLITARGLCEFDDVFHNVIGATIGIGVVILILHIMKLIPPK